MFLTGAPKSPLGRLLRGVNAKGGREGREREGSDRAFFKDIVFLSVGPIITSSLSCPAASWVYLPCKEEEEKISGSIITLTLLRVIGLNGIGLMVES